MPIKYTKKPAFRLTKTKKGIEIKLRSSNGKVLLSGFKHCDLEDVMNTINAVVKAITTHGNNWIWENEEDDFEDD